MVLLCLVVFCILSSDSVMGSQRTDPGYAPLYPRPPRRSSQSIVSSRSSSSSIFSRSSSSSSVTSFGCNDDRCGSNATYKNCPMPCPGTCSLPEGIPNCYRLCVRKGCECKPGFVLSDDGRCIHLSDCPDYLRCNDRNATFISSPNPCQRTCQNPGGTKICNKACLEEGCECKEGFYLNDNGQCVLLKDCPDYLRCGLDRNATFKSCPNPCPRTCEFPGGTGFCDKMCRKEGCECKEGFYLDDEQKCVALQDCPGARNCSANENFVFCNAGCPNNFCPEDDSLGIIACSPPFPCMSGCSCKANYLRLARENDRCIPASECPLVICTRPNEVYNSCPPPCLKERCSELGVPNECDKRFFTCRPRCICKPGFYRNDSDICVPENECRPVIRCGLNEIAVACRTICPPLSCEISYTDYACGKPTCEPGCDCIPNFLRNASGICIPNEQCPPPPLICRDNEQPAKCRRTCPPQTCQSLFIKINCTGQDYCEPGCDCIDGYLRNDNGDCIPGNQCFKASPVCEINEKPSTCRVICPPQTCGSIFTTFNCNNTDLCESGCDCLDGFLRDESGVCIPSDECFAALPVCGTNKRSSDCRVCPPQTCDSIFTSFNCNNPDFCESGCDCLDGFLRDESGICIPNEECFAAPSVCEINEISSDCRAICPPQTCDSIFTTFNCNNSDFCESGCDCLDGFLRDESGFCIPSEECFEAAPICEINEKPSDCRVICPPQTCYSIFTTFNCNNTDLCESGCDCLDGFLRDESGVCIPSEDCFSECSVPIGCRPTCKVPNPPDCDFYPPSETNLDGCNCMQGYILSDVGGTCIKIEECPTDIGCNGDPFATVKQCPQPCPSTCSSPNAFPCRKRCLPLGCECKPGYLLNKWGRCILPDNCKGGNPCGKNGRFVPCRSLCQNSFCPENDNRVFPVCETFPFSPCFSGCMCNLNHRFLSRDYQRCIRSDLCPPVNCTRLNECWNPCPIDCNSGYCDEAGQPPVTCNTLVLNCNPQCTCEDSFFRDPETDVCVSTEECLVINERNRE